jgi:hypothetical protein
MPVKRIQQVVQELSFEKKLLAAGSLLMLISVFLPWYQDIDSFKTGDMFLGINGPLYLVGASILVLAATDLGLVISDSMGRKISLFGLKHSTFFLGSGLVCFYLLMVVNSVYFHPKFGFNITVKESQFGMFFAFIAASLMTIGGYLSTREKSAILKEFQEKARENLIQLPNQDARKPKENLRSNPVPQRQPSFRSEPSVQTQLAADAVVADVPANGQQKAPQSYRTDL